MTRTTRHSLVAVGVAIAAAVGVLLVRGAVVTVDPLDQLARARAGAWDAHEGSWYFPRGGPYVLGFESPNGDATLEIDGRELVRGKGVRQERLVAEAGAHAVRLVAPDGARLLWHPPGRRGKNELEYVPPSSLAPEPPERASFGDDAGTSRLDGLFAVLLLAIGLGLGAFLARGPLRAADRRVLAGAGAVFALALAVRLIGLDAAGQTFDEDVNWAAGRNYVSNGLSLDFSDASWRWNFEHPPVSKLIAGIGAQLSDGYVPARALSALMVALACALLVPIGRRLFSLRAGVLAGAVAALTPHIVAHGKIVGHEAPTLLWWTLAVWLALIAHDRPPELPSREATRRLVIRLALCGAVLGLAISTRFVNLLLAPLLGALLLLQAPPGERRRTLLLGAAILPIAALIVSVVLWPRLWSSPIDHLRESWAKLKVPHADEPYLGAITNAPARHYFLVYLVATAPVGVLLGVLAWGARSIRLRERAALVVLLWLTVPLLALFSPVRQDGVRYIMPSLMALSIAAAAGVDWIASRRAFLAAGAVLVVYLAITCVRVHPYYLDYYGEQVGGPSRVAAKKSFEIAWWGEGIADAIDHVNEHAAPGARVLRACVAPSHLTWLRGDLWPRDPKDEPRRASDADWIIAYQPSVQKCPVPRDAILVHEVSVMGAPLARVYQRKGKVE